MHDCTPIPWDKIPESARTSVVWWIRKLADGQSASVTFQCYGGGVSGIREEVLVERNEDGSRQISVRHYKPSELRREGGDNP